MTDKQLPMTAKGKRFVREHSLDDGFSEFFRPLLASVEIAFHMHEHMEQSEWEDWLSGFVSEMGLRETLHK